MYQQVEDCKNVLGTRSIGNRRRTNQLIAIISNNRCCDITVSIWDFFSSDFLFFQRGFQCEENERENMRKNEILNVPYPRESHIFSRCEKTSGH